jgi:hypothetical protein
MQAIGEYGPVRLADLTEAVALPAGKVIQLVWAIKAAGYCTVRPALAASPEQA